MTERLYYSDAHLTSFEAKVVEADQAGTRVVLDRTAFYPTSGGQPHDLGTLGGFPVVEVIDEEERIVHVIQGALAVDQTVSGSIDAQRRFDHMQQHSGQHLLSAVFEELFGWQTLSFHLGEEASTIELSAAAIEPVALREAEERVNALIGENRPISVAFEDAAQVTGLRKDSGRTGTLRIVSITDCDRSACGGTHVSATGQIGSVILRKVEKIRGNTRLEFYCGMRAVRRTREEFEALAAVARQLSSPFADAPALVAALQEQVKEADKTRRKLALELAGLRGRALYQECEAGEAGRKMYVDRRATGPLDDEVRAVATNFCAGPNAVFVAVSNAPPAILLAASADAGLHAGNLLKEMLQAAGGRGGGSAQSAQGSLPSADALETILERIAHL